MKRQTIDVRAVSAAPPSAVWALLADVTTWKQWAPFDESVLERPGSDDPNGVGAIRRFTRGRGRVSREAVVAFEPETHFAYTLVEGLPIHDYRADVTLAANGAGGTDIRWRSTFEPDRPGTGWLMRVVLQRFVAQVADALAGAAGRT
jgi:Polyketide cyclase / dehydrase and lipid transport